jgi:hypothetical protein
MELVGDAPLSKWMRRGAPTVQRDTSLPEVFRAVAATRLNAHSWSMASGASSGRSPTQSCSTA